MHYGCNHNAIISVRLSIRLVSPRPATTTLLIAAGENGAQLLRPFVLSLSQTLSPLALTLTARLNNMSDQVFKLMDNQKFDMLGSRLRSLVVHLQ